MNLFCTFQVRNGDERADESEAVDTPNLLSCDNFVNLYVSWQGNRITIGEGLTKDHYILLQHSFLNWDPPKAVSFSSGFGRTGVWKIEEDQGK